MHFSSLGHRLKPLLMRCLPDTINFLSPSQKVTGDAVHFLFAVEWGKPMFNDSEF
jgi:hypothetical protein